MRSGPGGHKQRKLSTCSAVHFVSVVCVCVCVCVCVRACASVCVIVCVCVCGSAYEFSSTTPMLHSGGSLVQGSLVQGSKSSK